jgi:DNA helicase II / ATP-dependent DNA helicase PcrA
MEDYETLGAFLEHVSLVMDNDAAADEAKVTIMTIHAAKGLEFDTLFLPGWEEGVFPSQRSLDEGGLNALEEERRLAYVAITRARRRCTILHAANRRIYGQWTSSIPSRFIGELPADHVEEENSLNQTGANLWRTNWASRPDPFGDEALAATLREGGRGPGWNRAMQAGGLGAGSGGRFSANPQSSRPPSAPASAKPRDDLGVGTRIFHQKFGYGIIASQEGNKLEIDFDQAGRKRVLDSFVTLV